MSPRMRLTIPPLAALAAASALLLGAAAPARAATTLGQLDPAAVPGNSCADASSWAQKSSTSVPGYQVPTGNWVVTSWSHKANGSIGKELSLRVWRPSGDPNVYTKAGGSALEVLTAGTVNAFATRIAVTTGDVLGLRVSGGGGASCIFNTGLGGDTVRYDSSAGTDPPTGSATTLLGEFGGSRLNLTAQIEPDADADGYGDETQDLCPSKAAVTIACPPEPRAPAKPDTAAPLIKASAKKLESIGDGTVNIFVRASEAAAVRATGTMRGGSLARALRLRLAMRPVRASVRTTLKLKLPARTRATIMTALRKGHKVYARIRVMARDSAGNLRTVNLRIRLVR
jgi:hypothetical protein